MVRLATFDLDLALQVRTVLDEDAAARDVADHRAVLLYLHAIFRVQISAHLAVDDHFARVHIRSDFAILSDGEALTLESDRAFDLAVNLQILVAGDLALDCESRSQDCQIARRGNTGPDRCGSSRGCVRIKAAAAGLRCRVSRGLCRG